MNSASQPVPRRRPLDDVHIPPEAALWMRRAAIALGLAAVVIFIILAADRGVPRSTYFDQWEPPAQIALLAIASLGYVIALRWPGPGGVIMMQAGVALGVLATVEYSRASAFLACIAFLVPGTLFLLSWQRTASLRVLAAIVVVVAALLVTGAYASNQVYNYYFGPTHPESSLEHQPVDLVEWIWSGGVTNSSVTVKARLAEEHDSVRLIVRAEDPSRREFRSDHVAATNENDRIVAFTLDGLAPETRYTYVVEADGEREQTRLGSFETFPADAQSFTFAFSSCARTGSNGQVFDAIRESNPLFYLITGDFQYDNIATNDPEAFRSAFQANLTSPAQAALYQSTAIAYVWDDHDYGGNNADSTSAARPAARSVYRQVVPHYDLPAGDDGAIYQAFSAGRVRFIVTDTRSERTPASAPDDEDKSMLGKAQKAWFKQELLAARDEYALIVWVNADPWIDSATAGGDTWSGYDTERQELAAFIEENGIANILMVSGDAHMLAIDDGSNSAGGFPVFHAAALDRRGRVKGGPYSQGTYPGGGQFGLVTVNDTGGDQIDVILSGRNYQNEELVEYAFSVSVPGAP